jgi:hypothetical protein
VDELERRYWAAKKPHVRSLGYATCAWNPDLHDLRFTNLQPPVRVRSPVPAEFGIFGLSIARLFTVVQSRPFALA